MIFASVGTQLGFDRLIRTLDNWRAVRPEVDVVAQIGPGSYVPINMWSTRYLLSAQYDSMVEAASLLVSHAGVGSLLTACQWNKPIIMLPRRAELGEHRNNHQLEGAVRVFRQRGAHVAMDVDELVELLDRRGELAPPKPLVTGVLGLKAKLTRFLEKSA